MPNDVGANGQSIVTKKSGGKVITAPDVCKTPSPGGPIPIPYPNISLSSDLANGSKSVKVNGAPVCLKGSNFSRSVGDQAGSLGGVISGKTGSKAEPVNYSFNVKIEGKNVVRNLDMFQSNDRNTPAGPVMQSQESMGPDGGGEIAEDEPRCPYCNKPEHDFAYKWGTHIGTGQLLKKSIIPRIEDHPWYTGPNALQAHHLICTEAMDDDDWAEYCLIFGYSINHKNNGVMLPYSMGLACQLHVPVHRGSHSKGKADGVSYPRRIKAELKDLKEAVKTGKYCGDPKALVSKLDSFSKLILKKVGMFSWTITADGKDYAAGNNGCSGAISLTNKPDTICPHGRAHGLTKQNDAAVLQPKSTPLEIGI